MELVNQIVKHNEFGEGRIISLNNKYLEIDFAYRGIKTFIYPDAFEKFIVVKDESMHRIIMEEINNAKQEIENKLKIAKAALKTEEERSVDEKQIAPTPKNKRNIDDGFGDDYNVKYLTKKPVLDYQQVENQFGIKIAGFGRGINRTPSSVVLISSVDKKNQVLYIMIIGQLMETIYTLVKENLVTNR
ncbi:hypothetical protein [Peptostreptococcus faecalis]|uniref:hypothetical protein n=1 Tax=Peptostreptococcus faecalis TaxID=2045015 RepID=UPI000C7A82D2|nr:hypothetical protein [Peptostreptococcus faecalis]